MGGTRRVLAERRQVTASDHRLGAGRRMGAVAAAMALAACLGGLVPAAAAPAASGGAGPARPTSRPPGYAPVAAKVFLNGQPLRLDVQPVLSQGRLLVPFRPLLEAAGARVTWNPGEQSVTAERGSDRIVLRVGVAAAVRNGRLVTLDVPPVVLGGRTYVPLRFVGEAFGGTVLWDSAARAASVNLPPLQASPVAGDENAPGAANGDGSGTLHGPLVGLDSTSGRNRFSAATRQAAAVATVLTFDKDGQPAGQGSGFVVSPDGKLVTNHHVIDGAHSALALLGGSRVRVTHVHAVDETNDLAVLQLEPRPGGYPFIPLADPGQLEAGDEVVAIGSPRGFDNTISSGIVSAPARVIEGVTYIQHTAPVSPGSSGGPLLDLSGRAVGVVVALIRDAQNLNLAVPADRIPPMLGQNLAMTLAEYNAAGAEGASRQGPQITPEALAAAMYPVVSSWSTKAGTIRLADFRAWLAGDGTLMLTGTLDATNYLTWLLALGSGEKESLEAWVLLILALASSSWDGGQGPVFGMFFYSDVYDFYPSGFRAEEISLTADGRWLVTHPLARFDTLKGTPVYEVFP